MKKSEKLANVGIASCVSCVALIIVLVAATYVDSATAMSASILALALAVLIAVLAFSAAIHLEKRGE